MTQVGDQSGMPQFSADGRWWWDGTAWVPAEHARGLAEAFGSGPTPPPLGTGERQRLRLANRSWLPAGVRMGRYAFILGPGQAYTVPTAVGSYLARGSHNVGVRVLGSSRNGGEVIVL